MATIVNANDLQLYAGSNATRATTTTGAEGERIPFAHAQSVSLSTSNSLIDITTKSSDSWADKISGQKSFTLSTTGLVDYDTSTTSRSTNALAAYAIAGTGGATRIFFEFGILDVRYVGSAYISSIEQSGGTDDAPTYTVSLDSVGELTFDTDVES